MLRNIVQKRAIDSEPWQSSVKLLVVTALKLLKLYLFPYPSVFCSVGNSLI